MSLLIVLIVDGVPVGQHALMQDARNQNTITLLTVEQHMLAMLMTPQAGANVITESPQRRIVGKRLATIFKLADVTGGLGFTPFLKSVVADAEQVGLRSTRKSKLSHGLARHGELEGLADTAEDIALCDTTGIAFVNRRP